MKLKERERAMAMRKSGSSMREIAQTLGVSKSSVSLWVSSIPLSAKAQSRIRKLYTEGQLASQKSIRAKTARKEKNARDEARAVLVRIPEQREISQVMCSLIYWCEGAKLYANKGQFSLTNSDPALISTFLSLFRKSFDVDESKFRACVHLHGYHDENKQLSFWSKVTSIPREQFIQSFRKKESGVSIRVGYQGCVSVRYHDVTVLRRILAIANGFLKQKGL